MIRVFIGYDPREAVEFSVLSYSIQARASESASISPLMLSQLKVVMTHERHPLYNRELYALTKTKQGARENLMLDPARLNGLLPNE